MFRSPHTARSPCLLRWEAGYPMPDPTPDPDSAKIHGDKLESADAETPSHRPQRTPNRDALEAPIEENPQLDGGTKIHGDKLEGPGR